MDRWELTFFSAKRSSVWNEVYPYADRRVLCAARRLKLGSSTEALSKLVPRKDFARLVAALIRADLAKHYGELARAAA